MEYLSILGNIYSHITIQYKQSFVYRVQLAYLQIIFMLSLCDSTIFQQNSEEKHFHL
jgi:hypothetical protein